MVSFRRGRHLFSQVETRSSRLREVKSHFETHIKDQKVSREILISLQRGIQARISIQSLSRLKVNSRINRNLHYSTSEKGTDMGCDKKHNDKSLK